MTDKQTMTARLLVAVNDELGWNAVEHEDGDLEFVADAGFRTWIGNYAPGDPEYLRLWTGFGLAGFLEQAGASLDASVPEVQLRVLAGAARLSRRLKGAKVLALPEDDRLNVSVECVVAGADRMPSVDHLSAILPRMLSMLTTGVFEFQEEMVLAGLEASGVPDIPEDALRSGPPS